ncbi:hypothetical protein HK405_015056, partial [Cladochytrium tenue]
ATLQATQPAPTAAAAVDARLMRFRSSYKRQQARRVAELASLAATRTKLERDVTTLRADIERAAEAKVAQMALEIAYLKWCDPRARAPVLVQQSSALATAADGPGAEDRGRSRRDAGFLRNAPSR